MDDDACVVRGELSLALYVSRIFGVTPLRFELHRNGYKVTISHSHALHSYTMMIILNTLGLISFALDVDSLLEQRKFKLRAFPFFIGYYQLDIIIGCVTITLVYCNAKNRMAEMIHNLNIIEKTMIKIGQNYASDLKDRNKNKKNWIVVFLFVFMLVLIALNFIYHTVFDSAKVDTLIYLGSFYITLWVLFILETLLFYINCEVLAVFQAMCRKLRQLKALIKTGFIPDLRVVNNSVRSLSHSYVSGCDIVSQISKRDGMVIVLLFSWCGVSVFVNGYELFSTNQNITTTPFYFIKEITWMIFYITKAVVLVEPCHLITKEVHDMEVLLSQLMIHTTPVGKPVSIEMDILYKETILNRPTFTPLGLFTIDRSLIIVVYLAHDLMCSYISTYLVFSIQLKSQ